MKDYAVIFAADLPDRNMLIESISAVSPFVDGIKIAAATLMEQGSSIIKQIRDIIGDKPILVDLKVADIGFYSSSGWDGTNGKIIRSLENTGATHVTVHGFPGPASIAEAIAAAKDSGLEVLLLPLMSHKSGGLFFDAFIQKDSLMSECSAIDLHVNMETPDSIDVKRAIIHLGDQLGASGFIGPATRPDDLRLYRSLTDLPVWAPGFGRQDRLGRSLEEQFRQWADILGPKSAAIVGSAIFKAQDQKLAADQIIQMRNMVVG